MADTPNNDIEHRLRDYAQQRRDALGTPELHPATRAMLQAEVKQRRGAGVAASAPRAGWLRFWPRIAFALCAIVIVGGAGILLLPPGPPAKVPLTMAKLNESMPVQGLADQSIVAAAPTPGAAPAAEIAGGALRRADASEVLLAVSDRDTLAVPRENFKSAASPARRESAKELKGDSASRPLAKSDDGNLVISGSVNAASKVEQKAILAGEDRTATSTLTSSGDLTSAKPATFALAADEPRRKNAVDKDLKTVTRIADQKKAEADATYFARPAAAQNIFNTKAATTGQRFRNIATDEQVKQKAPAVLDEFTVAQDGEALTVTDRDGSVYIGYARIAPTEKQAYTDSVEPANPIQLVPNSNSGGRASAALEQRAFNHAPSTSQTQNQAEASQRFPVGQSGQLQNAIPQLNLFFRVEGTNRSRNERVIFTGNLQQNPSAVFNSSAGTFQNNQASPQNFRQQTLPTSNAAFNLNQAAPNAPVFNHVINGQVQLGNQKAGELNALSIDP